MRRGRGEAGRGRMGWGAWGAGQHANHRVGACLGTCMGCAQLGCGACMRHARWHLLVSMLTSTSLLTSTCGRPLAGVSASRPTGSSAPPQRQGPARGHPGAQPAAARAPPSQVAARGGLRSGVGGWEPRGGGAAVQSRKQRQRRTKPSSVEPLPRSPLTSGSSRTPGTR